MSLFDKNVRMGYKIEKKFAFLKKKLYLCALF